MLFIRFRTSWFLLKLIPLWLNNFLISTGLLHFISNLWSAPFTKTTLEIIQGLTDNKDLQTVLSYCWGDYGTPPTNSHFACQVNRLNSFHTIGRQYPTTLKGLQFIFSSFDNESIIWSNGLVDNITVTKFQRSTSSILWHSYFFLFIALD